MKLGIACLSHETITFWPGLTKLEDFEKYAYHGAEIIEKRRGTETNIGGFIEVCEAEGVEVFAVCESFGGAREMVAHDAYEFYIDEMRREFGTMVGKLDGILLALQGNIVTEKLEEAESHIVREIREVVGYDMPIMISMDLHANIAPALLDWSTVICGEHCMPHIDKVETGRRAARIMINTLRGEINPTIAMAKPGVVVPSLYSNTFNPPGSDLVERRKEWENHTGVLDISIFFGFAWADVPQLGMTMVAVTDDDPELAQEIVEDLAKLAWEKREELNGKGKYYTVKEGVSLAIEKAIHSSKPILVNYPTDRTGDTTHVLRELLNQSAKNVALLPMLDPEAAKKCIEAGAENTLELEIGAKTGWRDGGSLKVKAKVLWAGETKYLGRGARSKQIGASMWRKDQHEIYAPAAIVKIDGVWLQLTSFKCGLVDEQPFKLFGYNPRDFDIIASKDIPSDFSIFSGETITVDSPSQCPLDLTNLTWKNVPSGVYPITSKSPRSRTTTYLSE